MPAQVDVPDYPVASQVTVDPATTALLIVDMQNDFVRDNGKLQMPTAAATIPTIARLRDFARRHDMAVYYTQDSHEPGDPEFALWGEHVLIGSDGWKIIDELSPDSGDKVFQKIRYDGFFQTKLEETLQAAGIDTLIICGTVANICVQYTAASAAIRWYKVVLPIDCTSALNEFDMQAAIRSIAFLFGGVITTGGAIRVADSGD